MLDGIQAHVARVGPLSSDSARLNVHSLDLLVARQLVGDIARYSTQIKLALQCQHFARSTSRLDTRRGLDDARLTPLGTTTTRWFWRRCRRCRSGSVLCGSLAGRSRAAMALRSRLKWPMHWSDRCAAMRAACTRCGNSNGANAAKAREKVAASGSFLHKSKPHRRLRLRSCCRRSISASVVGRLSTALATKARARAARSRCGRPVRRRRSGRCSSTRATSSVRISCCNFGVRVSPSFRGEGLAQFSGWGSPRPFEAQCKQTVRQNKKP